MLTLHFDQPTLSNSIQAINELMAGLPIKLHDGSISSVIARIPLPNPLTGTVGFSLRSLHLTFHLLPSVLKTSASSHFNQNLADSVTSIAESFLHTELSSREEATLRESFHPDLALSTHSNVEVESHIP